MGKRLDVVGFFWDERPAPKPPKPEKVKCVPPERTWEEPNYLPNLTEALEFKVNLFKNLSLTQSYMAREQLVFDIECYPNYWLIAFMSIQTHQILFVEFNDGEVLDDAAIKKLKWVVENFQLISFNGIHYDIPVLSCACAGATTQLLWGVTEAIITYGQRPSDVLRRYKVKAFKPDHIDLIEVAPLQAGLKIYSGRSHAPRMQDLPFPPGAWLTDQQKPIVRWYCVNDLQNTEILYYDLSEQIVLRAQMSNEYGVDLRSKSDAQVAEAVINRQICDVKGVKRLYATKIEPETIFKFDCPHFISFRSKVMRGALETIVTADYVVGDDGAIINPFGKKGLIVNIAGKNYSLGIGGLHSMEEKVSYLTNDHSYLVDVDVESYYPKIILNQSLYPDNLGLDFLKVYQRIVDRRLAAKKSGDKVTADSLKITINGSFGKFGSMYSILYAPQLLIQVTLTGQLSLMMLIERAEWAGIPVVSANTDGIVFYCPRSKQEELKAIVAQWEIDIDYKTEETFYKAYYSANVNNYMAVKTDYQKKDGTLVKNELKLKGWFGKAGLSKNPTNWICVQAMREWLINQTPIHITVKASRDIRDFVTVRWVKAGAVKNGNYLGKAIRWYYAQGEEGAIIRADTGAKVPKSDGAKPLMELPQELPSDINYEWYINEAEKLLIKINAK